MANLSPTPLPDPWAQSPAAVLDALGTTEQGLSPAEAARRLEQYGPNQLPMAPPRSLLQIIWGQLHNPLIAILVVAVILSLSFKDVTDALFILAVILLNTIIGTIQEAGAEKSARALQQFEVPHAHPRRGGKQRDISATELVPGDIVVLETGDRVPADLRLLEARELSIDESLLTGESLAVTKSAEAEVASSTVVADRLTMVHAGSLVMRGRGLGVVVATGQATALGDIAGALAQSESVAPPLLQRLQKFTHQLSIGIISLGLLLVAIGLLRGQPLQEVAMFAVALVVSAIPEGLPAAVTIVLAVAVSRMSRRKVIVRRLAAVEALGSTTTIASDKTGTLTLNRLTVEQAVLPGESAVPLPSAPEEWQADARWSRLVRVAALCNEGTLYDPEDPEVGQGDAVDVAFLVVARGAGMEREQLLATHEIVQEVPFESERGFAAVGVIAEGGERLVLVKGAPEGVLNHCDRMALATGDAPLDQPALATAAEELAAAGYKVLAVAQSAWAPSGTDDESMPLSDLTLLGLVGMRDPVRPEAPAAIAACQQAGVTVRMVTGDHPLTATTVAKELGLGDAGIPVVTGHALSHASDEEKPALILRGLVFARVDPGQKLEIVESLIAQGEICAVTGDGANDAPALKVAHVGIAMGQRGTDLARETADLILTDDHIASLVGGIEEGRVAYGNVRKVVHLLVSTGVAEVLLVIITIPTGLPLPLTAVQLLWLNLVTNGIQDVALAFEPAEGDELDLPPRPPKEPLFNRLMVERVLLTGVVMGGVSFLVFRHLLAEGMALMQAQNVVLLLMVLFENIQVGACRSERHSAFVQNPLRNPFLLVGVLGATLVHVGAMYWPWLSGILGTEPVPIHMWGQLFLLALLVMVASELHKLWRRRTGRHALA